MLNQVILSGNLGHDPETKFYGEAHDQQLTTFSLAFRGSRNRTGWIRVTCFGRLAEVAEQHLHKGARVAVVGVLDQQQWEDGDGRQRNGFQIIAKSLEFIKVEKLGVEGATPEDDLPF